MVIRQGGLVVAMSVGALLFPAALASAAPMLTLTSGNSTVTVTDNGAGDTNPQPGAIDYAGTVGKFSDVRVFADSNSPGATAGRLQLTSLTARNTDTGRSLLDIALTDGGFNAPATGHSLSDGIGGTFTGAAAGDTLRFESQLKQIGGTSPVQASLVKSFAADGVDFVQSYSGSSHTSVSPFPGTFSLTQLLSLNLSPDAEVVFAGTTTGSTPEPGSVALIALGAIPTLARRRRRGA